MSYSAGTSHRIDSTVMGSVWLRMEKTTRESSRHSGIPLCVPLHCAWFSWFQLLPQQHHKSRNAPAAAAQETLNCAKVALKSTKLWLILAFVWSLHNTTIVLTLVRMPKCSHVSSVPISWKETGLDFSASNDKLLEVITLAKLWWCLHRLLEAFQEILKPLTSASVQSIPFSQCWKMIKERLIPPSSWSSPCSQN